MADTGEDRELRQRVNAHQAQAVKQAKQLAQKTKKAVPRTTKAKGTKRSSRAGGERQHSRLDERTVREARLDDTIAEAFPASDPPSSDPNPEAA